MKVAWKRRACPHGVDLEGMDVHFHAGIPHHGRGQHVQKTLLPEVVSNKLL